MENKHYLLFALLLAILYSCKKDEPAGINEYPPKNNELVSLQKLIGFNNGKEALWQLIPSGDDNCYYRGFSDPNFGVDIYIVEVGQSGGAPAENTSANDIYTKNIVGKRSFDGKLIWEEVTGFDHRSIIKINNGEGLWENSMMVTGTSVDSVWVEIFSSGGIRIAKYGYGLWPFALWFNDIAQVEESGGIFTFIAVGGAWDAITKIEFPLIAKFSINSLNNTWALNSFSTLEELANRHFVNLEIAENESPHKYIASFNEDSRVFENTSFYVGVLDEGFNLLWNKKIEGEIESAEHSLQDLAYHENHIYVVGGRDDPNKQKNQLVYRNSGVVACFDLNGDEKWLTKVTANEEFSDYLNGLFFYKDHLYAVGEHARRYTGSTGDSFGNGLLSKINLSTGELVANYTINNPFVEPRDVFRSNFKTGMELNGSFLLGGIAGEEQEDGPYRAWFIKINPDDL